MVEVLEIGTSAVEVVDATVGTIGVFVVVIVATTVGTAELDLTVVEDEAIEVVFLFVFAGARLAWIAACSVGCKGRTKDESATTETAALESKSDGDDSKRERSVVDR